MTTHTNVYSLGSTVRQAPNIRSDGRRRFHHQEPRDYNRRIYGDALDRWTNEGGALGTSYPSGRSNAYNVNSLNFLA
jgi:hypothetical protein